MPKCWIHSETAQPKKITPLKTHPGFPEDSITQGLALALVSKPQTRDLAIQPYRYWEFECLTNEIKELQKSLKNLREEAKKQAEEFRKELEQSKLDYQFLNEEKNKEIVELNHKLNQLITRILNISEKPTGTFDPKLSEQKGVKELLERFAVNSLEELEKTTPKTAEIVDIYIEPVKIEGKERSETKGMMTQNCFDLTITVSKRGENRDEGPHIVGDSWKQSVGTKNIYDEEKDPTPGSLTNKKVQTIIIPNAGESKRVWVGEFNKRDRNIKKEIRITGPFEKYDETTLTLTFKPDKVKLEGILEHWPL